MTRTTKLVSLLAAAIVAVSVAGPAGAKPAEEYVPFDTDFPQASEKYVPFVSDFPRPPTPTSAPRAEASGIDWGGTTEAGVAAAVAAFLAGAGLVFARRRHLDANPTAR